jgi:hypothetical protein
LWFQGLYSAWWWYTIGKANTTGTYLKGVCLFFLRETVHLHSIKIFIFGFLCMNIYKKNPSIIK